MNTCLSLQLQLFDVEVTNEQDYFKKLKKRKSCNFQDENLYDYICNSIRSTCALCFDLIPKFFSLHFYTFMFQVQCAKIMELLPLMECSSKLFLGTHSFEGTLDFWDLVIKLSRENFLHFLDM